MLFQQHCWLRVVVVWVVAETASVFSRAFCFLYQRNLDLVIKGASVKCTSTSDGLCQTHSSCSNVMHDCYSEEFSCEGNIALVA